MRDPRQLLAAGVACPVCGEPLGLAGASARCATGHSFDFARSGYLNLAGGGGCRGERIGDSREMVRARERFLAGGHYEPLARAVAEAAAAAAGGTVEGDAGEDAEGGGTVEGDAGEAAEGAAAKPGRGEPPFLAELGSGTGYYLDAAARALSEAGAEPAATIGVDLSKAAADRAAKLHPERLFLVADVEAGIPLRDGAADLCLSVFAPRPAAELGRVTGPGGTLLVALAGSRHLERLRQRLGLMAVGADKLERLAERLSPWFDPVAETTVEWELALPEADARNLVLMGPNARHDPDLTPLADGLEDRASVTLATFRRKPGPAVH